jgi:hypothetical protein
MVAAPDPQPGVPPDPSTCRARCSGQSTVRADAIAQLRGWMHGVCRDVVLGLTPINKPAGTPLC